MIVIQEKAIDVQVLFDAVHRKDAGAVVLFMGTVRSDRDVVALDYEVYKEMALKQMGRLVERTKEKFGVVEIAVVHRIGRIAVGRASVAIAVAGRHRREAFEACEWLMDQIKRIVPIWKTEKTSRRR